MSVKTKSAKKTKLIQTRLDAELVDNAHIILEDIGISMTDVIRILVKKIVSNKEVPLPLTANNPKLFNRDNIEASLKDIDEGKVYDFKNQSDMDKFVKDL
jgi:addiction module RelB/DinJ family antitoxin